MTSRQDISEELAARLGVTQRIARKLVSLLFSAIVEIAKKDGESRFTGFGTFRFVYDDLNPEGYLEFEPAEKYSRRLRKKRTVGGASQEKQEEKGGI